MFAKFYKFQPMLYFLKYTNESYLAIVLRKIILTPACAKMMLMSFFYSNLYNITFVFFQCQKNIRPCIYIAFRIHLSNSFIACSYVFSCGELINEMIKAHEMCAYYHTLDILEAYSGIFLFYISMCLKF